MPAIDTSYRAGAPTCLAIGNFDGVHLGHRALLSRALERALALGVAPTVLTFDPHPAQVLGRGAPPQLTTLPQKSELLHAFGFAHVLALGFDAALAATSAEDFARRILFEQLAARVVAVGENYRFGRGRAGDVAMLHALGAAHGVEIVALPLFGETPGLDATSGVVSSSRIREALADGRVADARRMLGRPHRIAGTVIRGDALGRTLGYPTANLGGIATLVPNLGVYAVDVRRGGRLLGRGALNVGTRPTVTSSNELRVEVYVLDFDDDLYGSELEIDFLAHIRDDAKFDSLDALKEAIASDVTVARLAR